MSKKNNNPQKAKSKKILTRFLENVVGGKGNGTKKEEDVNIVYAAEARTRGSQVLYLESEQCTQLNASKPF